MSDAAARSVAVRLVDLTVAFRGRIALDGISGSFAAGGCTAIVGPNGAGKSTLLAALMGQVRIASGRVDVAPVLARQIAYLPQRSGIDRNVPLRVLDFVSLGHWRRIGNFAALGGDGAQESLAALASVGLVGFEERLIGELSAGQFQRVLFARAMVQNAALILLDEPFSAVDATTVSELLDVIADWRRDGRTVIAALHDLDQVRSAFDETLLLARRCVAWGPTPQVLSPATLAHAEQAAATWRNETRVLAEAAA